MINLELYRIFYIVANCKNITKASKQLNISQPAVTKHIKNLEQLLGEPLFVRTKKGVVLNQYGEKIYKNVKQAIILFDEAERKIDEVKAINYGNIKIGISTSLTRKYLLKHIETFHEKYPNIHIDIDTDPTEKLIKKLRNGIIDIIISKFPEEREQDLNYNKLGTTKYIFVASNKYKELYTKRQNIQEVIKYPLLLQKNPSNSRRSIEKYFKENNIKVDPVMNVGSSNLLIDFIKISYGVGYITKLYAEEELKSKVLYEIKTEPDTENIDYGIITLKNSIMPSYCSKFIDYLNLNK